MATGFKDPNSTPHRRILNAKETLSRAGFRARSTLWRKVRHREFPAPVDLGGGRVGWFEDEVVAWMESRPRVAWAPVPADDGKR
jgi:prophage regulatory protein